MRQHCLEYASGDVMAGTGWRKLMHRVSISAAGFRTASWYTQTVAGEWPNGKAPDSGSGD